MIPTHGRAGIAARTLGALAAQTVAGFETIVVVDGEDQPRPELPASLTGQVVVQPHAGPGAARNHGVRVTERPLVLFLGDDMIPTPTLVERHLAAHEKHATPNDAVLGHVDWHPEVARSHLLRWMDWSGTQFEYHALSGGDDVGFARFYSCNVSLSRELFLRAGGFDEDFAFYYEDLDLGWRLGEAGMRLWYDPGALVHHLHSYDLGTLRQRFAGIAAGEWMMTRNHEWFEPWYEKRVRGAVNKPTMSRLWPAIVDYVPKGDHRVRNAIAKRANWWYHQQVAPDFLIAWDGQRDLDELQAYLGDDYRHELLQGHAAAVDAEEHGASDELTFYRSSQMYLYDLTAFAMTGTKYPYLARLREHLRPNATLLDWGCGIGTDGLRFLDAGYKVSFADFANPSAEYLRWRLEQRSRVAPVYDIEHDDVPGGFDAAYCLDVIEHVEDPWALLAELESRADIVMVNFLEPEPNDTHLHKPLPIPELLDHATRLGLLHYRRYHGRSHLVIYRSTRSSLPRAVQSRVQRAVGDLSLRRQKRR